MSTTCSRKGLSPLFGNGSQTRDFVYVDDVARANILALSRPPSKPEVFNVCTGAPTRIRDLVSILRDLTGKAHAQSISAPSRTDEIEHSFGDYSKAKSALGYEPRVNLREGLSQLVEAWARR